MDRTTTTIVNVPLVFMSLLMNSFFIYCLGFSDPSEKLKQPVSCLLCTLVCSSVTYLISMLAEVVLNMMGTHSITSLVFYILSVCTLSSCMTTSVWLNFFYYTKIVPAQQALSIWIKKNVKRIIYVAWFFERIWTLLEISLTVLQLHALFTLATLNYTTGSIKISLSRSLEKALDFYFIFSWLLKTYFIVSVYVMVWSTVSMSCFLVRHVAKMIASGQAYSSPKFCGQVRVVITGILQGLLYLLCGAWICYNMFREQFTDKKLNENAHYTVCNVFMFGTTLNLWVGQSVFRQRAVNVIQALKGKLLMMKLEL
ncbi:uncharacterized protein LOC128766239 isoform X1 [Synchiropus splendidus]|uniref:uncharacterized protein LOC128766239 isoform X1 n=1 Tax=Synchiropus splendidus TaxID=270530 RepID=UPI00237DC6E1|nr:uncharacterized protein LOC128766239 isoform X1 [Synchiropus splendidus]XP_053733707.1 uncharacterized protein LOC128766239 isoform X1 [Synchiropus splendidus]XP_053733708.1 uncharacterized protein LOC128766239 isoform X1 [Synchiropus splendidus]XP_053733709.1 uncharacterized protein LOC128766239 isoform X1 [Synchiropus splendidus]